MMRGRAMSDAGNFQRNRARLGTHAISRQQDQRLSVGTAVVGNNKQDRALFFFPFSSGAPAALHRIIDRFSARENARHLSVENGEKMRASAATQQSVRGYVVASSGRRGWMQGSRNLVRCCKLLTGGITSFMCWKCCCPQQKDGDSITTTLPRPGRPMQIILEFSGRDLDNWNIWVVHSGFHGFR